LFIINSAIGKEIFRGEEALINTPKNFQKVFSKKLGTHQFFTQVKELNFSEKSKLAKSFAAVSISKLKSILGNQDRREENMNNIRETLVGFYKKFRLTCKKSVRHSLHFSLLAVFVFTLFSQVFAASHNDDQAVLDEQQSERDMIRAASLSFVLGSEESKEANVIANDNVLRSLAQTENGFLANNIVAETSIPSDRPKNKISKYVVSDGDTLWSIARQFNITTDTIKWTNKLSDVDFVKPGTELAILPVAGVLHKVASGDTIEGIAQKYKTSASLVIAQNSLEGEDIVEGLALVVPDGVIEEPPAPRPQAPSQPERRTEIAQAPRRVTPTYSGGPNRFPWGYCTWLVAAKRNIPWNGNAWQWYGNAQSMGYAVGSVPAPGAVYVSWESPVGHVGYVESVNGNTFTISEMNYYGFGVVNTRTIQMGSVPLIGFVY